MMKLLLLFRLPVMAAGACVGGLLAGHLYMRAVWASLERKAKEAPRG